MWEENGRLARASFYLYARVSAREACNPENTEKSKQKRKSPRKLRPPDWGAAGTDSDAGTEPAPGCPQGLSRTSHTPQSTSTTLAGDISKIQTRTPTLPPGGSRLLHLPTRHPPSPPFPSLSLRGQPSPKVSAPSIQPQERLRSPISPTASQTPTPVQ